MEDERIVPALVSVYKAEVWRHLGFCVMSAPGPHRGRHLGSAACHVLCEKPSRGGRQGRCAAAAFSSVGGVLCSWGGAHVAVSAIKNTKNINTN